MVKALNDEVQHLPLCRAEGGFHEVLVAVHGAGIKGIEQSERGSFAIRFGGVLGFRHRLAP